MSKKQESPIAWGNAKQSRQTIIAAAARCFEQYGPQRTSMDDIAEAAGISRKTLYRVFSDRPKLVQSVMEWRWGKMTKQVQQRIAEASSFEEALLEGAITAVAGLRNDKLANDIVQKATDNTLEQFLIRGNERIHKATLDVWRAAIDLGRQEGTVKQRLSDERIVEIIISIFALLIMHDESPDEQRALLKDILLPAIMTGRQPQEAEINASIDKLPPKH